MGLKTKYLILPTQLRLIDLSAVENKTLGHSKNITTPEFNQLTAEKFAPRLAQVLLLVTVTLIMMEHNFQKLFYTLKRLGDTEKVVSG